MSNALVDTQPVIHLMISRSNSMYNIKIHFDFNDFNIILAPCDTQLSRHALRCGPKWGGRCNKNKVDYALYCKVSSGWCSRKPKSNSPTRDDSYDWEPASCKGILFFLKIYEAIEIRINF